MSLLSAKGFKFGEVLGEGGFGTVFRATKISGDHINTSYAVKRIAKSSSETDDDVKKEVQVSKICFVYFCLTRNIATL